MASTAKTASQDATPLPGSAELFPGSTDPLEGQGELFSRDDVLGSTWRDDIGSR